MDDIGSLANGIVMKDKQDEVIYNTMEKLQMENNNDKMHVGFHADNISNEKIINNKHLIIIHRERKSEDNF